MHLTISAVSTSYFNTHCVIEQVASNKSCLLLTIQMQNTQKLKLFTDIIKAESIFKSN